MENKERILELLLPALQETRFLEDLESLEYDEEREFVVATYKNGCKKVANVACDSGIAMIRDVIKTLS